MDCFGFSAYQGSELKNHCTKLNIPFGAMVSSSADQRNTSWIQRKIGFNLCILHIKPANAHMARRPSVSGFCFRKLPSRTLLGRVSGTYAPARIYSRETKTHFRVMEKELLFPCPWAIVVHK